MKNDRILPELTKEEADILEDALLQMKEEAEKNAGGILEGEKANADIFASSDVNENIEAQEKSSQRRLERQRMMTLAKIQKEIHTPKNRRRWKKRTFIVWIAAAILLIGSAVSAAVQNDWDMRIARQLGIEDAMEYLDGGYVKIGESCMAGGVTVTVSQAIGDQNSQWIQVDTDVKWDAAASETYMFHTVELGVYDTDNRPISGGYTAYTFEQDGFVSMMIYAVDFNKINRSNMTLELSGLMDLDATWQFQWENRYEANTITRHPLKILTAAMTDGTQVSCLLTKIEISPVSVRIEAYKNPGKRGDTDRYAITQLTIDAIKLKDGFIISMGAWDSCGEKNSMELNSFVSLTEYGTIDPEQVESIVVEGEELHIN